MLTQRDLHPEDVMPPKAIREFFARSNWLYAYLREEPVKQVYTVVADPDLLYYRLCFETDSFEVMYLLDKEGKLVSRKQTSLVSRRKYCWGLFGPLVNEEVPLTVLGVADPAVRVYEILYELGNEARRVERILSYYPVTQAAILYVSPDDRPIGAWPR